MNEDISVLLDGEGDDLERERALRALSSNPELRTTWERYHLASAAIRRELDVVIAPGLADRIHECLQLETQTDLTRSSFKPRLLKFSAGLAIAASVAAVALLNLPPLVSPSSAPVALLPSGKSTVADARQTPADQRRALNPYLVQHGEFTSTAGMNGMLSYVRVVSRDNTASDNVNPE